MLGYPSIIAFQTDFRNGHVPEQLMGVGKVHSRGSSRQDHRVPRASSKQQQPRPDPTLLGRRGVSRMAAAPQRDDLGKDRDRDLVRRNRSEVEAAATPPFPPPFPPPPPSSPLPPSRP